MIPVSFATTCSIQAVVADVGRPSKVDLRLSWNARKLGRCLWICRPASGGTGEAAITGERLVNMRILTHGVYGKREKRRGVVHFSFLCHRPGMSHDLNEDLDNGIAFALSQFPYQPPRSRNPDERRSYFLSVARAVRRQLQFSWSFHKKPPHRLVPSEWKPDAER